MANKLIITWDDSNTDISLEGEKPVSNRELIGVMELAKMIIFEHQRRNSNENE